MFTIALELGGIIEGREVRAFGFDVDGVLRDTAHRSWQALCRTVTELGGTPPTHNQFVREYTADVLTFYRACGVEAKKEVVVEVYRRHQDKEDLVPPFPDVVWFLNLLQVHDVPAFVVSSSRLERVEGWLREHKLRDRFVHVVSASANKRASIIAACAALEVAPEETCYIGDLGCDMQDALYAGVIPIGITREYHSGEGLTDCGAARVAPNFATLAAYLGSGPSPLDT